jgi:hypothetical protein
MDKAVWEAARSARAYLHTMLEWEKAARLDGELAELLNAGLYVEDRLRTVLNQHKETTEFLENVRQDPHFRPAQANPVKVRGFDGGLPGQRSPVGSDKYGCPRGDYVWYRISVDAEIGCCPTHPECRLQQLPLG